jgi:3-oxoacyl-[acyl-carrier-protein] synthase III
VTLDRYGNTAAASIPIALATAEAQGRLRPGDHVLLVGGAAGFSAAVIPVVWSTAANRSRLPA